MRNTILLSLLGAALTTEALVTPAGRAQIPLTGTNIGHDTSSAWHLPAGLTSHLKELSDSLHGLTGEVKALWEELAVLFPEVVSQLEWFSSPKKANRQPDSTWDYVLKGKDVIRTQDSHTDEFSGYQLRTKKVDPSKLGVDSVKQYSGYLDVEEDSKHFFYWFFESRNDPKNDPVVLWLNGGPGCSSLTGLFMELGPSWINKSVQADYNEYSWNSNASVIFLDQPVNVGYSYSDSSVSNTVAAGKDVYALLSLFFEQFPEYAKQDFHIAGESYAGHYIPVFTSEILSHKTRNINLKSVLIGNGLTDGYTQYAHYEPFACGKGGWKSVLPQSDCDAMTNALPRCQSLIENCYNSESVWSCVPASIYCNNAMMGPYQRTGLNVYDIRGKCEDSSNLCYPQLGYVSEYLNRADVMNAVGADVSKYESCNFDINRNFLFQGDWMKPYHRLVPKILDEIPVLIYAGNADFICNWLGNQAWTDALEWKGQKGFVDAKKYNFTVGGKKAGFYKSSGNFTFLQIENAGHMVPYNQPEASLKFFNSWLNGKWWEKA